jgi:hypothetical protein
MAEKNTIKYADTNKDTKDMVGKTTAGTCLLLDFVRQLASVEATEVARVAFITPYWVMALFCRTPRDISTRT